MNEYQQENEQQFKTCLGLNNLERLLCSVHMMHLRECLCFGSIDSLNSQGKEKMYLVQSSNIAALSSALCHFSCCRLDNLLC
jgi:hypothetical protein